MALKMMDFGQTLVAELGAKAVAPTAAVVGGMKNALKPEVRDGFLAQIDDQIKSTLATVDLAKKVVSDYWDVIANVGATPTYYVSMAKKVEGEYIHDIYDGELVVMDPDGNRTSYAPKEYHDVIGECNSPHSYATHTYVKSAGYPDGIYRVNTLANINAVDHMATPLADAAMKEMKDKILGGNGGCIHNVFAYHWARIIELVEAIENVATLLKDPEITNTDIMNTDVHAKAGQGVGMVMAPRGNLIYDLTSDADGICRKLNILVATNHNMAGIEKNLKHVAKQIFEEGALDKITLPEPMLK
jgi:coenzyme F420-reducing hydrogenase alpha subunit